MDLEITSAKLPQNTHLIWEISSSLIYMVDSTNQLVLLKSVDKGDNWTTVTTRDHKIQAGWNDDTYIWIVDCDNDDTADDFDVWKITTDGNDTITSIGTSAGADANSVFVFDIFKIGSEMFVLNIEKRGGGNFLAVVWDVDAAPFVEKDTVTIGAFISPLRFFGDVVGNIYYTFISYSVALDIYSLNYDHDITTISIYDATQVGYTGSASDNLRGISYDGDDLLYFVAKNVGDNKNYLFTYSITGTSYIIYSEYNIALMLDRNCSGVIPNENEKAFGIANKTIYEIGGKSGSLFQLQNCENLTDANIIAITDNFFMNSDGDVFEYTDVASDFYHPLSFIEHSVRDCPKAKFMFKGTWIPHRNDCVRIYDYLTSNGSTTFGIVFEGSVTDYDLYH